jgi:hypothetical protein
VIIADRSPHAQVLQKRRVFTRHGAKFNVSRPLPSLNPVRLIVRIISANWVLNLISAGLPLAGETTFRHLALVRNHRDVGAEGEDIVEGNKLPQRSRIGQIGLEQFEVGRGAPDQMVSSASRG